MRCRKSPSSAAGVDQLQVQQLRIDVGDDALRGDLAAIGEHDADRAAALGQHARDRLVGEDLDAARDRFARHRLRDRAHAAERVAPLPALAVDLAEDMVQQHVRRARRVRAREVADDRVEAERRLDRVGLEPAVEHVARALGEQVEHVAALRHRQALELARRPSTPGTTRARRRRRWAASPAAARAARRRPARASRSTPAAPSASLREKRATSACVPPRPSMVAPPTFRYSPPGSGRKFAIGRSTIFRPCSFRHSSWITFGCSRLTV